jgi:transposase
MSSTNLFGEDPQAKQPVPVAREGRLRLRVPERNQVELRPSRLEDLLPDEHRARSVWEALEQLDLSGFYEGIGARAGSAGRPAIDPRILVALWLYATIEGVGSARDVARLCEIHDAYRWICGGVGVNHHTLSDFRVGHSKALDELMTQILGALLYEGLVGMRRVAQDGMKVRASAGAASFRRKRTLKECLHDAREQVRNVRAQLNNEGGQATARVQSARLRAAKERSVRVAKALSELEKVRESKDGAEEKKNARVSTTDAEARVMKMADGGWRPAYNVQIATDVESRVIVGVKVTNQGNDFGQTDPMLAEIGRRTEKLPKELLVDGGYRSHASIERAEAHGVKVYAPLPEQRENGKDPSEPKPGDGPGVSKWRQRMRSEVAGEIYKDRAATAERTNADLRCHRGLDRFQVRGIGKVLCVALWSTIAFNVMRCVELGLL